MLRSVLESGGQAWLKTQCTAKPQSVWAAPLSPLGCQLWSTWSPLDFLYLGACCDELITSKLKGSCEYRKCRKRGRYKKKMLKEKKTNKTNVRILQYLFRSTKNTALYTVQIGLVQKYVKAVGRLPKYNHIHPIQRETSPGQELFPMKSGCVSGFFVEGCHW